jgi:tetratricopeptide (TPR) repeat protein
MKSIFKNLLVLLCFIPSVFAQKEQIREAQKEFKSGNLENVLAVLSPVEYLIPNASNEDKINFYYIKGSAILELSHKKSISSNNLTQAITAFSDLMQVESEIKSQKHTPSVLKSLSIIKEDLIASANEDLVVDNFSESSNKFYQAYLIDKKDTLQLYNAAVGYKSAYESDLSLKCFELLKDINYYGNIPIYIAYSRSTLSDEFFDSIEERDSKIKSGTHLKPRVVLISKKPEIYRNIASFYIQKGFKEKAIKVIETARNLNFIDESLAIVEANLYLEIKDYDVFDKLATAIIDSNPDNAELLLSFGLKCQKEKYHIAAEYYFKKAIAIDSKNLIAYVNLSALLVDKSIEITSKMNDLGTLVVNKKKIEELKYKKEQLNKIITPYLQKIVSIDPFNSSVVQLVSSLNSSNSISNRSIALND